MTRPALRVISPSTSCERFHVQLLTATLDANCGRIATRAENPSNAPVMPTVAAGLRARASLERKTTRSSEEVTDKVSAESNGIAVAAVGGSRPRVATTAGNTARPADATSN